MDEFVADQWLPFDINKARYELFTAHIEQTAKNLTFDPDDQDDIRSVMWLKCLEIRRDPPKDYPQGTEKQNGYCAVAMYNAALYCLYGDLPDGPKVRPSPYYVDPDRRTLTFTETNHE